ncbi:MAG: hypothetical protein J6R24_03285 [Clostridia bacterium]|nr:hypothetical protein [Clostridia bacterium]MBO7736809.1 hypothetical protein [Clostridia bacterium]
MCCSNSLFFNNCGCNNWGWNNCGCNCGCNNSGWTRRGNSRQNDAFIQGFFLGLRIGYNLCQTGSGVLTANVASNESHNQFDSYYARQYGFNTANNGCGCDCGCNG